MSYDAEKNIDLAFKTVNLFLSGTTTLFDVVEGLLEYCNKDPAAKLLQKHIKYGGDLNFTACKKELAYDLEEKFRDEGVVFLRTESMANGGVNLFVFPSKDGERVEKILNEFRAEHRQDVVIDDSTMAAYSNSCMRSVDKLSYEEATLFVEHAEKKDIPITIKEPKTGEFKLIYAEKDQEIINHIKANVALELSGKAGEALRKQLAYEKKKAEFQTDFLLNDREPHNSYLVDLKGNQMQINDRGITYQSKDTVITVERTEPAFKERAMAIYLEMREPVLMTEKEKDEFDQSIDKKKYLASLEKNQGRPAYTEEEYRTIREMMKKKELYEMKLALAEPNQAVFDLSLENDEMRLATFEEFNDINEQEANKDFTPEDEEIFKEVRQRMNSYIDSPEMMDYEQVDFENSILDDLEQDYAYNKDMMDLQHDKNNNLMPDQYENRRE